MIYKFYQVQLSKYYCSPDAFLARFLQHSKLFESTICRFVGFGFYPDRFEKTH